MAITRELEISLRPCPCWGINCSIQAEATNYGKKLVEKYIYKKRSDSGIHNGLRNLQFSPAKFVLFGHRDSTCILLLVEGMQSRIWEFKALPLNFMAESIIYTYKVVFFVYRL